MRIKPPLATAVVSAEPVASAEDQPAKVEARDAPVMNARRFAETSRAERRLADPKSLAEALNKKTVSDAAEALGIAMNTKTDPSDVRAVLREMRLDDLVTKHPAMRAWLAEATTKPQDMGPMLARVADALAKDNPAIVEFLKTALQKGWLHTHPRVKESLHTAFVLEAFTAAMANDVSLTEEVQAHFLEKRRAYGIAPTSAMSTFVHVWKATGSFFEAAKTVSIDPAITRMNLIRRNDGLELTAEQVNALYGAGKLSYPERQLMMPRPPNRVALKINIHEAGMTERSHRYADNSVAAHVLMRVADEDPAVQSYDALPSGAKFPHDNYSDPWVKLYETWNLAFVLSELDDLHVLFPKLLIPSVLCADSETYMGNRILALWLCINTLMFKRLDGVDEPDEVPMRREMAEAWGAINKKHAEALARETLGLSPKQVEKEAKDAFRFPVLGLGNLLLQL